MKKQTSSAFSPRTVAVGLLLLAFVGTCSCQRRAATPSAPSATAPRTGTNPLPLEEAATKLPGPPPVRVAVLKDVPLVALGGRDCSVFTASGKLFKRYPGETNFQIRPDGNTLQVNGETLPGGSGLSIESGNPENFLRIDGQETAARVVVYRSAVALTAVAQLSLEDYLSGVLAGEVPFEKWHPEALRAQAVASRTYALYQTRKNAAAPYDVECTVMSQVFRGGYRNNPILSSVVQSTRGLVLTCDGAVFPAYFHSTCGGATASAAEVFPDQPFFKPLRGAACAFCANSPHYRWKCTLNKSALAEKLRSSGVGQRIVSIEFLDGRGNVLGNGGRARATQVRIRHERGTLTLGGNQFRLQAGPKELKSLLIEQVVDRGDSVEITGGGFGHGVGLCQYGAEGMARAGYGYPVILGAYYPGAALTKLY